MPYAEFQNVNASEGIQTLFVYANEVTGGVFTAMLLFMIFVVVMLSTYFAAKRINRDDGNFPASFAVAGFITAAVAIVMSFVENLINMTTLVVAISISVIGLIWLFFPNKE